MLELGQLGQLVLGVLRDTAALAFDPSERIYWVFLLSAGLIAVVVARRQGATATPAAAFSWLDIKLLGANALIRGLGGAIWSVSAFGFALVVVGALDDAFGPMQRGLLPAWLVCGLYTIVLFVAWDASRWLLHRAMHVVPALWELHQVHHSASGLTPLTLYRTHPLESVLYSARGVLVTGTLTGLFFYLFRRDAVEVELLGVNILGFAFNLVGANLRHSHVWWSWGRVERWFLSPAQHQLHHSIDEEQGTNLGTWLSVWDRWAGTFLAADAGPPRAFGLPHEASNHDPQRLASAIFSPLRACVRRLVPGRGASVGVGLGLGLCLLPRGAGAQPSPAPSSSPRAYRGPTEIGVAPQASSPTTPPPTPSVPAEEPAAQPPSTPPGERPASKPPATELPTEAVPLEEDDEGYTRKVVVGSMFEPGEVPRLAGSAQVIGNAELEKHEYDDFHRVLSSVPGVYVRNEDGFGLRPNIGLRGANPDRSAKVTLMEDGILMGPAPYSAPAAYYFPLTTRMVGVEVFKGPASIRFGPNTVGGAINLRTREIPEENESVVDVAGGRYDYGKGHAYWGTRYKGFGVLLEAAHVQTSGFKELDGGGDTGFAKNDTMLKLGYQTAPGHRIDHGVTLKVGFANERSNETYLGLSAADFESTPNRRYAASQRDRMTWWRTQAELSYLVQQDDALSFEARLYRHDFDRTWRRLDRFVDGPSLTSVLANPDSGQLAVFAAVIRGDENSTTPEDALMVVSNGRAFVSQGAQTLFHWRPHWKIVKQDLEVGARLHQDSIVRNHVLNTYLMTNGVLVPEGSDPIPDVRNRGAALAAAFHLHDTVTLWDRFSIAPGVRLEVISTEFEDRLTDMRGRDVQTVVVPGLGAMVDATRWLAVFGGVHRGFSAVAPGQPEGTEPEFSINYELGARALHEGLQAEAVGFFSDYSNLSGACTFSSGCDVNSLDTQFNAGAVYVYGLESLIRYRHGFDNGLRVAGGAQYTYTGSQFRTDFNSAFPQFGDVTAGDELPYLPKHLVGGEVGLGGRIWDITAKLGYTGQMRDVAGQGAIDDDEQIPGFLIMDLAAEVRVLERFRLYALVNNATNNTYLASRRPFGIRPGAPLSFIFGVKAHIF